MKIILTETQLSLIRRISKLKELVDEGIDVLNQEEDLCNYTYSDFLTEVCWQVSDNMDELGMDTESVGSIEITHKWVVDNFNQYIRERFDEIIIDHNCSEGFDDSDDDYLSGLMYGVDNLQESKNINFETILKRRKHNVDEFIESLDKEDICRYWRKQDVLIYVDEVIIEIIFILLDSVGIESSYPNAKKYFHKFYSLFEETGYVDNITNFFMDSINNCYKIK